jgi:hypothetical protein
MYAAICGVKALRAFAPARIELCFSAGNSDVCNKLDMLLQLAFLALRELPWAHPWRRTVNRPFVGRSEQCGVDVTVTLTDQATGRSQEESARKIPAPWGELTLGL